MRADPSARWIACLLRNDPEAVRRLSAGGAASFADAAAANGVLCLAARALLGSGQLDALPSELRQQMLSMVRREQALELGRRAELKRTSQLLNAAGVPALVFKGAALAYTHYQFPHLRPRVDTDLLVRTEDRARAMRVLQDLGYHRGTAVDRDALFTQCTFYKGGIGRINHQIDLHWKVANRPLFRDILSFDELARDAIPVEAIGASTRTPGALHSLLLACTHPVAHHHCEWPLIWLYDVSLLAERLSLQQWGDFRKLAAQKRVSVLCKRTFQLTEACLGPTAWFVRSGMLDLGEEKISDEPSARYLSMEISARRDLSLDLAASHGVAARCRLLLSHAFPDVDYIRQTYQASGWVSIAAAYGRRMTGAGAQLLRPDYRRRASND